MIFCYLNNLKITLYKNGINGTLDNIHTVRQHFHLHGTRIFTFTGRGWKTNFYQLQCYWHFNNIFSIILLYPLLSPWSKALLENLRVALTVKESDRHWSLS